ncbi:MAG: hypothetical protein F6K58_25505 [Symploca sp. SIO2E9]|nr:hypothetical protein [Symploca sp. SIO2E9]
MPSSRAFALLLMQALANAVLCFLINQLTPIKELGVDNPFYILVLTFIGAVFVAFTNGLEISPKPNNTRSRLVC